MHYAFDTWMARNFPGCPFERYADDAVVHCTTRRQAEEVLCRIAARMEEVGLTLHPDKTRIVYCKDGKRRGEHEHTSFTFLGYAFRARKARGKNGGSFTSFLPAMSPEALKAKSAELREMRIHRRTDLSLDDLAAMAEPHRRRVDALLRPVLPVGDDPLLRRVNAYLRRWAGKKYERLRTYKRFKRWWTGLLERAARPVRPLASGSARSDRTDEKSPVTGDCHAGIRGSRGLRCPRPPDPRCLRC